MRTKERPSITSREQKALIDALSRINPTNWRIEISAAMQVKLLAKRKTRAQNKSLRANYTYTGRLANEP